MIPPARPIRTEMTDAVVAGIRARGAEAVGLLIVGIARIAIAVLVLVLLLIASKVIGIDVSAVPFAAMTGLSALVSWLITRKQRT
ncbi:MAG TPA: hypothetical protein VNC16_04520 [Solirubrobacterales bacterium]|nr:hypothetical protein [Solirubrobacterales bacterium]